MNEAECLTRNWVLIPALLMFTIVAFAQSPTAGHDCSTLKYKRHTSAWLCGRAQVCSGDICMGPSDYGFDTKFDVVLRDAYGNKLDFQKLSYEQPKFCFEGRKDSEYQLAFVLYKNGLRQPARVFPTRYRRNTDKANDVFYMIGAVCPGE